MECGDGILVPSDCGCVCDDFAEVASLAGRPGGVPVGTVPPADAHSTVAVDRSYEVVVTEEYRTVAGRYGHVVW